MENSSDIMPEIPGFRYDASRKRYFKMQPGEAKQSQNLKANLDRPRKRMKSSSHTNMGHRPCLYRYLKNIETNHSQPSIPAVNSFLLSAGLRTCFMDLAGEKLRYKMQVGLRHRKKINNYYNQLASTETRKVLWDMDQVNTFLEVRRNLRSVTLRAHLYPIGGSDWKLGMPEGTEINTCSTNGSWVVIGSLVGRCYQVCSLRVSDIEIHLERPHYIPIGRRFSATVAISNEGLPALAIQRSVFLLQTDPEYHLPQEPKRLFNVSGKLPIDNLKVFEERIVGSIFNGKVFVYDMMSASPLWESKGGTRVVDLQSCDGGKTVFVSSMLNTRLNLVCWDTRIPYSRAPPMRFEGHRNSHKQLRFHVDTSYACGVLAAGGDDGFVRLWDARMAALPLKSLNVEGEIPEVVKLAGFRAGLMYNPCLWVQTENKLYLYQSAQPCLY